MKVLMLGWEFPPHISGGLGTACQGLTLGLARTGVEILFMVPRAYGDEPVGHMRMLGANQVRFARRGWRTSGAAAGEATGAGAGAASAATLGVEAFGGSPIAGGAAPAGQTRPRSTLLPTVEPGAPLSNYADPGDWRGLPDDVRTKLGPWLSSGALTRLSFPAGPLDAAGWRRFARAIRMALEGQPVGDTAPAAESAPEAEAGVEFTWEERLPFHGGYGADLLDQVARYALAVAEVARREHFDVIHAHDWISFPAAAAAAEVSGKPLIAHVHASEHDRSGDNPNPDVKAIEQLGLDVAQRVVCVSHYTASVLKRRYRVDPAKLRVVHNAVTQQEQRREWRGVRHIKDPIVLFLGRVTFQKGPDYFLEAAARVTRLRPDVLFVISGSGDMLPAMVERSAGLGLARNVIFTGFLRGKDVERVYSMADLYVMPSVSEPFGITPLEAMALDVPVIVSRQSGVSEILTHALKVDFWDVEELANKILAVLEYPPLRHMLVESGRDEVRRMRWELRGQLVKGIYEELVK